MLQEPAGPPDESVDVLFQREIGQTDDSTLAELLKRPRFSDCTLKCQGTTWRCHRAILASRCDFFSKIFGGSFQESASQTVVLDDGDPKALEFLLVFLYTKPARHAVREVPTFEELEAWSNVVIIADKYGVFSMVSQAHRCVENRVNRLDLIQDEAEREESLGYIVKAAFGAEACPGLASDTLKHAIALQACKQFKQTPGLRTGILQSMGEHAELRKRMTEMSLLTDSLKNIKAAN